MVFENNAARLLGDTEQEGGETPLPSWVLCSIIEQAEGVGEIFPTRQSSIPWEGEMGNWLERYRGYILITVINLVVLGGMIFFWRRPQPLELTVTLPTPTAIPTLTATSIPTATPLPTPTPRPLRVYVSGAVTAPDVYKLPAGSIIKDAIEAAGGATSRDGLECINLALPVADSQHVYVPRRCEETPTVGPPTVPSVTVASSLPQPTMSPLTTLSVTLSVEAGGKVNINTASQSELETLPGIGPSRAQDIIENRPYHSIEEIKKVPGIGEATFQKIKDLITVD
jgi:competence protein ComEA